MLCAKMPSKLVANSDYHGGQDGAHDGHVDNVAEDVQEMWLGPSCISVAHTRAKVAASCDVPEKRKVVENHQLEEKEKEDKVKYVHVPAVSEEEVIGPNCQKLKCMLGRVCSLQ